MKKGFKLFVLVLTLAMVFTSCNNDDDAGDLISNVDIDFNFTHHWDGTDVTSADFAVIQYTNANGEEMSVERLRYLISNMTFTPTTGDAIVINGYNLVDVTNNTDLNYNPSNEIPEGTYTLSFTFGFNNEDNLDGAYEDLNSVSWNVPAMLGGGYHYMQLEGKFIDNTSTEKGYQYHAIRAVDASSGTPVFPQDTFITVELGTVTFSEDVTFEIKMNIAEWFKNPNQWDLNVLNSMLMGNPTAQIMMSENGESVFSLGTVTEN